MKKLLLVLIITCISMSNIDNVSAMDTEYNEQYNAETEVLTSIEYKNAFYEQIKNVVKKYHDVTIMTKALYEELQNRPEAKLKVPHDGNHLWTDTAGALIIIKVLHQIIRNNINNKTLNNCKEPVCICEIKIPIGLMLRINQKITENITLYFDKDGKLFIGNNNNIDTWQPAMLAPHAKLSKFAKYKPQILSKEEHEENQKRIEKIIYDLDKDAEEIINSLSNDLCIPSKEQLIEVWMEQLPQNTDKDQQEMNKSVKYYINQINDTLNEFLNKLKKISNMSQNTDKNEKEKNKTIKEIKDLLNNFSSELKKISSRLDKTEKERNDIIEQIISQAQYSLNNFLNKLKTISNISNKYDNCSQNIKIFEQLIKDRIFSDINYVILKSSKPMEQLLNAIKNSNILSSDDKLSIVHLLLAFYDYQIKYSQFWPVDKWNLFAQQIMDQLHAEYMKIRNMINKLQYEILDAKHAKIKFNINNTAEEDDWTIEGEYKGYY